MEPTYLLVNLAGAVTAALLGAILAVRLGQSPIMGYLLAGLAIGPFTPGFVGSPATVEALAEIGIVFLMFVIGLHLSLPALRRASRIAVAGGIIQVVLTIAAGYAIARGLGWGDVEALFFGAVASNSSSTVLTKVLGERGDADTEHGRVALAWSSVQDISTVFMLVIASTFASPARQPAADPWETVAMAAIFLLVLVPLSFLVLPRLFGRVTHLQNRELLVLAVAAVALGMAFVASTLHVSVALGAFLAGIAVGQSELSHWIIGEATPLRDIFAALFFVSIGMLVDPRFILSQPLWVATAVVVIVLVKGAITGVVAMAAGATLRNAVLIAAGLAQSAEFSFLLARVGVDLGFVSLDAFSVMLSGAVGSILAAPLVARAAPGIADWLSERAATPHAHDEARRPASGDHAVVCGYGRVGQTICATLEHVGCPFVVIEENARTVDTLRDRHIPHLVGDAARPAVLDRANLRQARLLLVAIPERMGVRRIIDHAKRTAPGLRVVVRSHSDAERGRDMAMGASEAVMGELELALEMSRHALTSFGVGAEEAQAILDEIRRTPARRGRDL